MANQSSEDKQSDGGASTAPLKQTPLNAAHKAAGARMVPFAGYEMPIQYTGIIAEHQATRTSAGLFDVSHMGQADVVGEGAAAWLEELPPSDIKGLKVGACRYSVLTNSAGGVVDDLIITNLGDRLRIVVNGARREAVAAHFAAHPEEGVSVTFLDRALIAIQGPEAEAVLAPHVSADLGALTFMTATEAQAFGADALISRSGYTGEDGFELSLPVDKAAEAWAALVGDERVSPVGLGARDTLRLEAGLCLYGQDLTEEISPVEGGVAFVISKRRREDGGFLGADRILAQLESGPPRHRVGLKGDGRVPVRAGATLHKDGKSIGIVTSGGVGPTVGGPIALALVAGIAAPIGTKLEAEVRGKPVPVTVTEVPFVPAHTKRKGSK